MTNFYFSKRRGNSFGGSMYVCLSVCNMITFESLDVESSFLVSGNIFGDTGQGRL